jgi:hypothetical protein
LRSPEVEYLLFYNKRTVPPICAICPFDNFTLTKGLGQDSVLSEMALHLTEPQHVLSSSMIDSKPFYKAKEIAPVVGCSPRMSIDTGRALATLVLLKPFEIESKKDRGF